MSTTQSPSATISVERLGPAGINGELIVVAHLENDPRTDAEKLHDSTARPFTVTARLGKTALVEESIKGDFSAEDGDSYITLPDEFVAGRVRWNGAMMEFKKNSKGQQSLVTFECTAQSVQEARKKFQDFALPFIDSNAYIANCPIFVQTIKVDDINNHIQSIEYISPYRKYTPNQHIIEFRAEIAPIYSMYREAKNSHSNFYKFLCYHKILDGLLGELRAKINMRARKAGIELQKERDVIPVDPEIPDIYQGHIGKTIKSFYDDVLTPQFRNAVAHFITKDGAILNLSDPKVVTKYSEVMYISEICVRTMIASHIRLLGQLPQN